MTNQYPKGWISEVERRVAQNQSTSALPDNWPQIHAEATKRLREQEANGEFNEQFFKDWKGWTGSKHPKDPGISTSGPMITQIRLLTR